MLEKTGPLCTRNSPVRASRIGVPAMSLGSRSGVNWMRLKPVSMALASVRTMSVLARPGSPSSSTCPPVSRAMRRASTAASVRPRARARRRSPGERARGRPLRCRLSAPAPPLRRPASGHVHRAPADHGADDADLLKRLGIGLVGILREDHEVRQLSGRDRPLEMLFVEARAPLRVAMRRASLTVTRWLGPHTRPSESVRVTIDCRAIIGS